MESICKTKYSALFCLIAAIFLLSSFVSTQVNEEAKARLEGTIIDIDKNPIQKAEIELRHKETGQKFSFKSNKKGEFVSSFLPPGTYTVTVTKEGYLSYTDELELQANIVQKFEITLVKEDTEQQKKEKEAYSTFDKGVKLAAENKFDEAIQTFTNAIELKPDFAEAYLNMGILFFQQEKDVESEKALLKALELKPEIEKAKEILADVYFEKARKLIQEEKTDDALEILKKAYSFREGHGYVNYLLGFLYYQKEMKDEAIKHFEAFLKLEPNSPQAEKVIKVLESLKKGNKP